MKQEELRRIIQEEVNLSLAHHFELLKEWASDQFKILNKRFDVLQENMDKQFTEIRELIKKK